MGMFDEIIAATGMNNSTQSPQHAGALSAIMEYINSPQVGGISGLQRMFQEKGLGNLVSSWVGTGQNEPISTDQLQNVLHGDALHQAAQKAGIDPSQLTSMMSSLLPGLVDKLTPNGRVPDSNSLGQLMKSFGAGQR
jgi:uncharacterized protein YidB (DUF937 family)